MIEIHDRQILIDGQPRIVLCGEIHYFRLPRAVWQDRLDKLKAAGCNAVASYVPWLCHEPVEGEIDLAGQTRPELDLGAFIDLCRDNGLWFVVRPGPFIMAEMKNEGLPYWLYQKYPEIVPVGWDGKPAPTRTADYLAPDFLNAAQRWYQAVMAVVVPRLSPNGGNVIAVQLDNEIGMLAWVSNSPDLTEHVLADFAAWLQGRYKMAALRQRYPFELNDPLVRAEAIRSPDEDYAACLLRDLGHYMRDRARRYVDKLRAWAECADAGGIPFLINLHGSGNGRGTHFPIGISQLYEVYRRGSGYLPGSDFYLGNLTADNFQDLYLCNAFLEATQAPDQPLCCLEFECSDGDYAGMSGTRYDPSAVDFKLRMCIAQGYRLLNFYLFAGGFNYRLEPPPNDSDDRIAITGERHGWTAPVSPEGELNDTFPRMASAIRAVTAVADKLVTMREERDGVAVGFMADYFMTEYRYPHSAAMKDIVQDLEAHRAGWVWESLVRALLFAGYRFGAVDIQNEPLEPGSVPVLVLPSARHMDSEVQAKLAAWLKAGGNLLLYGEVPVYDMEGSPCTLLAQALGVRPLAIRHSAEHHYLSLCAEGWAAPRPELHTHYAQVFELGQAESILRLHGSGEVTAFAAPVGRGQAIVIATAYPCDISLFRTALEKLGATAGLRCDGPRQGVFATSMANRDGEGFLHLLNLEGFEKALRVSRNGKRLLGGREIRLLGREGVMLPIDVRFSSGRIRYATAEIMAIAEDAIEFRRTQPEDIVVLETERMCLPGDGCSIRTHGPINRIRTCEQAVPNGRFRIVMG